jgi:signal transduction histidine kinase
MSFRYRLVLFLVVALAAVQALTAISAYFYLRANLLDRAKRDLVAATGIFMRQLDILSERASSDVEILSLDYALRRAIAQRDYATELSALRNHGKRVGATRMLLVSLDGTISADTGGTQAALGRAFPYADVLAGAAESGARTALVNLDGKVYWMVVVPVMAPVPIAFIAACIPVNDVLLEKLQGLSTISRSVALATVDAHGRWLVVGKTKDSPAALPIPQDAHGTPTTVVARDGNEYLTVATVLPHASGSAPLLAVLAYPVADAFAAYRAVVTPVLFVLVLALIAAAAIAYVVVRNASRPLEALAANARRIAEGDYTVSEPLAQKDEIGQLSIALSAMTLSIAERESLLTSAIDSLEIARQEAVAANEAKSQFLANMSHELRTPLNAILGFGEMLQQEVLGPIGAPRYTDYARDICSSGRHLLDLVSRLLDVSDIEAGRFGIARNTLDAEELLVRTVESTRSAADKAGVTLSLDITCEVWPILGDETKLTQALTNVLENAIKFTLPGGEVVVAVEVRGQAFVVSIEDTGIGMRDEDIALVTQPFHRLRGAFDGRHQGAGLGLPFAKAVAALHGGTLNISSRLGRGTIVEMVLPLAPAERGKAA